MKLRICIALLMLLASCKSGQSDFQEIRESGLTVQVMGIRENEDTALGDYRVRIFPEKGIEDTIGKETQNNMLYKMDSCFYLLDKSRPTYPVGLEPIANGMKNSYEYLLLFDKETGIASDSLKLVYKDQYLNKKAYVFNLKKD